jgi:nicotinamidase-related amidase
MSKIFPNLDKDSTLFCMIDMQEKLVPAMSNQETLLKKTTLLLNGLKEIDVKLAVTEQYPKGLGPTLQELKDILIDNTPIIEKNSFSVFGSEDFNKLVANNGIQTIVFWGIESHVCLLQSVLDARKENLNVIIIGDAVSSRFATEVNTALECAKAAGAWVIGTETLLFMLMKSSAHSAFKAVSKLVR